MGCKGWRKKGKGELNRRENNSNDFPFFMKYERFIKSIRKLPNKIKFTNESSKKTLI